MLEFAEDNFIFGLDIDILVRNGWDGAGKLISEPSRSNIQKSFMMPLPGFNME